MPSRRAPAAMGSTPHIPPFDDALRGEDAERNGQIEGGAGLADVRRTRPPF